MINTRGFSKTAIASLEEEFTPTKLEDSTELTERTDSWLLFLLCILRDGWDAAPSKLELSK